MNSASTDISVSHWSSSNSSSRRSGSKAPRNWSYYLSKSLFTTIGSILSTLSTIDCHYISAFAHDNSSMTTPYGYGVWTIQDADNANLCNFSHDHIYGFIIVNGDPMWTATRVVSLCGFVLSTLTSVIYWKVTCSNSDRWNVLAVFLSIFSFTLEGLKIGLFFGIQKCTSNDCSLGDGSYLSVAALGFFLLPLMSMYICPFIHNMYYTSDDADSHSDTLTTTDMTSLSSHRKKAERPPLTQPNTPANSEYRLNDTHDSSRSLINPDISQRNDELEKSIRRLFVETISENIASLKNVDIDYRRHSIA